jgi:hypothetical protein
MPFDDTDQILPSDRKRNFEVVVEDVTDDGRRKKQKTNENNSGSDLVGGELMIALEEEVGEKIDEELNVETGEEVIGEQEATGNILDVNMANSETTTETTAKPPESVHQDGTQSLPSSLTEPHETKQKKKMSEKLKQAAKEHEVEKAHKTAYRQEQGKKMRAARKRDVEKRGAIMGSKVNVKLDRRDVTRPQGLIGIAIKVSAAGCCYIVTTLTRRGIIGKDQKTTGDKMTKQRYYVAADHNLVLPDDAPVHKDLEHMKTLILSGQFNEKDYEIVTKKQAHEQEWNPETGKNCNCRSQNYKNCACSRAGKGCTENCTCFGLCKNPFNPPSTSSDMS